MSLSDIPTGASVIVDANVLIYARRGMSSQCSLLLKRCAKREINGALATVTIVEFCHRRMMQEAQAMGLTGSNPAQSLSQQPGLVRQLTQYARDFEDLLAGEFTILAIFPRQSSSSASTACSPMTLFSWRQECGLASIFSSPPIRNST